MKSIVTLNELKKYSEHIDTILEIIKNDPMRISFLEKTEILRFYVYARSILENLNNSPFLFIDIQKLDKEEVITLIEYFESNKVPNKGLLKLLNSDDRETVKLGIEMIKNYEKRRA